MSHNPIKIGEKDGKEVALVRNTGKVAIGDEIAGGLYRIVSILRTSRQQGMDLVTVEIARPAKTQAEIKTINRRNDASWECHLERAAKRQERGDWGRGRAL